MTTKAMPETTAAFAHRSVDPIIRADQFSRGICSRLIAVAAIVVWLLSGAYMFHFGASWHLDLRVYRAAGDALYHGGSPFTVDFTHNRLPFT